MPHATEEPITNGTKPSSQFISHLTSYPVVSDSIETFKSHPYGKKSLELADGAYAKFGKPVEPYLETPYSYAKPYLSKADELGDKGLGKVEGTFPIVKQETGTIVDTAKSYVFWPFQLANDGKQYVLTTYNDEYEKTSKHNNRGPGVVTGVMAIVSTELKIASDFFAAVADFLGPKYDESKKQGAEYVKKAQQIGEQYKEIGEEKFNSLKGQVDGYTKDAQHKAGEYQRKGEHKAGEAKQKAEGVKEEAKKQAN